MDVIVTSSGVATGGGRPMVLVVDDETDLRELLRRWLLRAGYDVADAANADDALERLRLMSDRIAVVVTDLDMPGTRGEALITRVQAEWPRLPVLVLTGGTERVPSVPASRHLDKPVRCEHLVDALVEALRHGAGVTPQEQGSVRARGAVIDEDDVEVVTLDVSELLDVEDMFPTQDDRAGVDAADSTSARDR